MTHNDARAAFLKYVQSLAEKTWDGQLSEFRVMHNRNGASVMPTTRKHFSTKVEQDEKKVV